MACVYRHIRLDKNEPFYIGIGNTIKRAYSTHGRNTIWKKIVAKSEYKVEILLEDLLWEDVCNKEIEFIQLYGRINIGTGSLSNLTNGGEGALGYKHTKEGLLKISNTSKGRVKSSEQIEKWKQHMTFIKTKESIEKFKITTTGRKHNDERKLKNSISHLGIKCTEEAKEKLRLFWEGKKRIPFTEEHLEKLSTSHKDIVQSEETKLKRKQTWLLKRKVNQ